MGVITAAVGIGLAVSLLFGELFGITAGGMIVPGYVAYNIERPLDVAATLVAALLTFAIVRGISSVAIVYGRRRTALMILVGYLVGTLMRWALGQDFFPTEEISLIGYIIPGLIAIWLERQGIIETIMTLLTASVVVRLVLIVVGVT